MLTSCILMSSFITMISFSCWMSTDGTLIWTFTIPIMIVVTVSYHNSKAALGFSIECRKTKSTGNVNTRITWICQPSERSPSRSWLPIVKAQSWMSQAPKLRFARQVVNRRRWLRNLAKFFAWFCWLFRLWPCTVLGKIQRMVMCAYTTNQ